MISPIPMLPQFFLFSKLFVFSEYYLLFSRSYFKEFYAKEQRQSLDTAKVESMSSLLRELMESKDI